MGVNWAFLVALENFCNEEDANPPSFLHLGSRGLLVLCVAYNTEHSKIDWDVGETLKAVHGIFKHAPARRVDYLADNDIIDRHNDHNFSTQALWA